MSLGCCGGQYTHASFLTLGSGEFIMGGKKTVLTFQYTFLTFSSEILEVSLGKRVSVLTPGGAAQPPCFFPS